MASYGSKENLENIKKKKASVKSRQTRKKNKAEKSKEQIQRGFDTAEKWNKEAEEPTILEDDENPKAEEDGESKSEGSD